jgi:hypothetical protein
LLRILELRPKMLLKGRAKESVDLKGEMCSEEFGES